MSPHRNAAQTRRNFTILASHVRVDVPSEHDICYLADFYQATPSSVAADQVVIVTDEAPMASHSPGAATAFGVHTRQHGHEWTVSGPRPHNLISARKLLRRCAFGEISERLSGAFHASGFELGGKIFLAVGDKGAGKTTLMLDAVLNYGARYLANDVLLLFDLALGTAVAGWPTYIRVKADSRRDIVRWADAHRTPTDAINDGVINLTPGALPSMRSDVSYVRDKPVILAAVAFAHTSTPSVRPLARKARNQRLRELARLDVLEPLAAATPQSPARQRLNASTYFGDTLPHSVTYHHVGSIEPLLEWALGQADVDD